MDGEVLPDQFWRNLVALVLDTKEVEWDCEECLECLDQYVDLLESGQELKALLPEIELHLKMCPCCRGEMRALAIAIKTASGMTDT